MVESRKPVVMKHNPGFLAADELIASFIARQRQLESLLETLRHNTTQSNQHILVIGRRGMGKTMLVHRLALAIERDAELATRWYPILFGEEAYGVSTAGEFWLEALHQLATQTNDPRWQRAHVELRKEKDDRRLRDLALARLLDFADERRARLMIVVENLQDILGDQMTEDAGWELRHTLLNEPRIMLLATATNRFDDVEQPKKAMYELFGVLKLQPLARDEVRVIWQRLTGELLQDQRIRPIEIFTGGSPRLLAILASFARGRSLEAFMTDILGLVDDHSDYFKSNIEALSREERRAFTALCELWEPSPARAVAEVARFDVNKTSMLLGRLVDRGAVEIVRARGRTQYYQVCERLYNLFHRLRRSPTQDNRAASIVEFMTRFYAKEDLRGLAARMAEEACGVDSTVREDYLLVLHHLMQSVAGGQPIAVFEFPSQFWSIPETEREDLHWNQTRQLHQFLDLMRRLDSTSSRTDVGPDERALHMCRQIIAGEVSANEGFQIISKLGASSVALVLGWGIASATDPEFEKNACESGVFSSQPPAHEAHARVALAFTVAYQWSNPRFRSFSERQLLAALALVDNDADLFSEIEGILVHFYAEVGESEKAMSILEHRLALRPSSEGYYQLGGLLESLDSQRAQTVYRAALELTPNHSPSAAALVRSLGSSHATAALAFGRGWLKKHPTDRRVAYMVLRIVVGQNRLDATTSLLDIIFAGIAKAPFATLSLKDWAFSLLVADNALGRERIVEIGQAMLQHRPSDFLRLDWFSLIGDILSISRHPEVVELVMAHDARESSPARTRHIKFALATSGPEQALDVLEALARDNPAGLGRLLDIHRHTLLQLALANPERLHAILSSIPLFEPLAFALAQELGQDVLAPYEITEIAKDIRAELAELRGHTYSVAEPQLAIAAEDAPRPLRSKKPPKRRKPSKR
jgi:tetratricopeptide (TPR) repeat protein